MRKERFAKLAAAFGIAATIPSSSALMKEASATPTLPGEAYIRIVDVGNALCVIAKTPDHHYMLYDAGNYNTHECTDAVHKIVGNNEIDLIVLSHSDADHIGELPKILSADDGVKVDQLVYTGRKGTAKGTWTKVAETLARIEQEGAAQNKHIVRNLRTEPLPNTLSPAQAPLNVRLGDATVTFVAGWNDWAYAGQDDAGLSTAEKNNVISIVVKFTYAGKSVLLTGDTIGRSSGDPSDACRYAEKWMIEKSHVQLKSNILIGQHHGGDNSSSSCFIKAVQPDYVVFSAGHVKKFDHPRATTVSRFLQYDHKLSPDRIFRTDRGDDQGAKEWDYGRQPHCVDKPGDDDVEIFLSGDAHKAPEIRYAQKSAPCPS